MTEIWLHGFPTLGRTASWAALSERQGFTGVLLADSELLVPDPYVELALAAARTTRLHLGVGVTNPVSRHPAVTAASVAAIHAESNGRAVLGLARGDSALRLIDLQPADTDLLTNALRDFRGYLGSAGSAAASSPAALRWLPPALPPVPIDLAATGPKTIRLGAVLADRLTFNLGADVDRLAWAVELARQARCDQGLDPGGISLGAYLDVACLPDAEAAVAAVRGSASIFARFLAEGVRAGVPLRSTEDRAVLERVARSYQTREHGLTTSAQAGEAVLPDDFLRRFAVCGAAGEVGTRLHRLADLGLDRLILAPTSRNVPAAVTDEAVARIAGEILPSFVG